MVQTRKLREPPRGEKRTHSERTSRQEVPALNIPQSAGGSKQFATAVQNGRSKTSDRQKVREELQQREKGGAKEKQQQMPNRAEGGRVRLFTIPGVSPGKAARD